MIRRLAALLVLPVALAACNRGVDPTTVLEAQDIVTGWYDAGVVEGHMNKLVPSISLKLRNKSDASLRSVQINAIFKRRARRKCGASTTVGRCSASRSPPGATTRELVLRSRARLHRRTTAPADAAEPRIRRRESRNIPEAGIEGLG